MSSTGLFGVDPEIRILVPRMRRTTLKHAKEGRPWMSSLGHNSPIGGGEIRVARVVRAQEESISADELEERLRDASELGVTFPGWAEGEWMYDHFIEIPRQQGGPLLGERIREQGLRVIFVGTQVFRKPPKGSVAAEVPRDGFPAILQGNKKLDFHVLPKDWSMHIFVACYIPNGVVLDD